MRGMPQDGFVLIPKLGQHLQSPTRLSACRIWARARQQLGYNEDKEVSNRELKTGTTADRGQPK